MAATAIHRLTLDPMGKCSNAFSETTNIIKENTRTFLSIRDVYVPSADYQQAQILIIFMFIMKKDNLCYLLSKQRHIIDKTTS
jgi:hypothetical protein